MSGDQFGEFVSGYRGVKGAEVVVYLIYHKDGSNRNVTVESQVLPKGKCILKFSERLII